MELKTINKIEGASTAFDNQQKEGNEIKESSTSRESSNSGAIIKAILFPEEAEGHNSKVKPISCKAAESITAVKGEAEKTISEAPKSKAGAETATCKNKQIEHLPISLIVPNPNQPRKDFSEAEILKLADSIRQHGIIQPITVRKLGQLYELVAGERRLRALKELNHEVAPCIIIDISEEMSAEISIIENLIRQDLNIFEQAIAIQTLIDTYCLTQEQVAEKLSSSQSSIANKLRLLRFSRAEREILLKNRMTERHARALLRICDPELREKAIEIIINNELNVTATENLVDELLSTTSSISKNKTKEAKHYKDIPSFYNVIKSALNCAKSSDLGIKYRKVVGEAFTEITIIMPNNDIGNDCIALEEELAAE